MEQGELPPQNELSTLSISIIIAATSVGAILISIFTRLVVQRKRFFMSYFRMWAAGTFIGITLFHTPTNPMIDMGGIDPVKTVIGVIAIVYLMMWWIEYAIIRRCMSHSAYKQVQERGELTQTGSATVLDSDADKDRIHIPMSAIGDLSQIQYPIMRTLAARSVTMVCFFFILVHSVMSGVMIGSEAPSISEAVSVAMFCVRRLVEMSAFVIMLLDGNIHNIYRFMLLVILTCVATPLGVAIVSTVDYDFWPIVVYCMASAAGAFLYMGCNYLSTRAMEDYHLSILLRLLVFSSSTCLAFTLSIFV